ncbi:DUF6969 family protein [Sphingopyxis sp. P1IMeth2]|uniref:DUF6969 family protein n=1 Tax=Sphingopyxis sp. P1IMeth2 TaxID=1892848 RepID=UPI0016452EBB|nr:hypothetical protein [Sphingopyxis sp. P1IMeth2]
MEPIDAATVVIDTIVEMAREARPLMLRVLPDVDVHWWAHYPDDDARDAITRSRWYYHVHPPGERDEREHGHFHLFLHRTQIDPSARPIAQPPEGEDAAAHVAHVAGLSIDGQGIPIGWFATNRWVTDEFLYSAEVVIEHLPRYSVDRTPEDAAVNRFLTAMVALYRDEIAGMLRERDARLAVIAAASGGVTYCESGNDILASRPIDLDEKIASLGIS